MGCSGIVGPSSHREGVTSPAVDDLERLRTATDGLDAPFALVDLAAFRANAEDMVRRASGTPIRVASKSVRCRTLLADVLARPGFAGVLAFTLPEALWLRSHGVRDIVVAYPTVNRRAVRAISPRSSPHAPSGRSTRRKRTIA